MKMLLILSFENIFLKLLACDFLAIFTHIFFFVQAKIIHFNLVAKRTTMALSDRKRHTASICMCLNDNDRRLSMIELKV